MSKIINKIINKKKRIENGFRLELNLSIPHSKALLASREFFSNHKEVIKIITIKIIVKPRTIFIDTNKLILPFILF